MTTWQRFAVLVLTAMLFLNLPSFAWDAVGHMAVAYMAYQQLTPAARTRANALIALNPDYSKWQQQIPAGTPASDKDLILFMIAATWPDQIKDGSEYTEKGDLSDGPKAGQNVGYKDPFQHRYWHFVDTPFSDDHTALPAIPVPNAETQIKIFRAALASSTADDDLKSYDLVWLLHLVGDVHQPLHCSTRVSSSEHNGDQGGNKVHVTCPTGCNEADELHALWDNALGAGSDPNVALAAAKALHMAKGKAAGNTDTATWVKESFNDAKSDVYKAPIAAGDGPFVITEPYEIAAKQVAGARVALAGARLAKVINLELK